MSFLYRAWRIIRWPFYILLALYLAVVVYRIPAVMQQAKTAETVAYIQEQRIDMSDVDGSLLPPPVDPLLADKTIAGVDLNANGIRDDVEREIFKRYPDDIKTRAAALQYAMGLQLYLTHVFNSETLVAVIQLETHGDFCLSGTVPTPWKDKSEITQELATPHSYTITTLIESIEDLVFNTKERKEKRDEVFRAYMTSYGGTERDDCDINPETL